MKEVLGQKPCTLKKKHRYVDLKMSQTSAESFKEIIGFLRISMSLHTRLAAETHLSYGEFLQVAVNNNNNNNNSNNNKFNRGLVWRVCIFYCETVPIFRKPTAVSSIRESGKAHPLTTVIALKLLK
jgi:hypothetical protein